MLAFYFTMLDSEEDKEKFTEIYNEYRLPCYYVAMRLTKNHEMAEDAVHNAFLAVIKHKEKIFDLPCGKLRSLIVIITKNKAIDLLRIENIRKHIPFEEVGDNISADDFDLSTFAENHELFDYLLKNIASLPEIYKTVFEMRFLNEKSNQEIADELGITTKAVSMRISRAKIMLQEIIDRGDI